MKVLLEDKNKVVEIPDGLSPEAMEAELRKFYTPEELYGSTTFAEREGYRVRKGRTIVDDGKNWYEAMTGGLSLDEAKKRSEELNAEFTPENDEKYQAHNWPERFAGATTELAPYMLDSAIHGGLYGEALGGSFAGAAFVAGQAGPQAAFPEEIVTVPGAYIAGKAVGQAWGTWMNAAKVESGHLYKGMIDDGINPETARNLAVPAGYLIGAIELLQIERLLPGFGREGIGNLLKAAAKKGSSKAAQTLGTVSGRLAKNLAETTAIETAQEVAQEIVGITAEVGAGLYEDMANEQGYIGPDSQEIKERLSETLTSSLLAFPLLGLPGSIHNTASLHAKEKFADRLLTKKAQDSLKLELTEYIEQASGFDDFQEFHDSLGEEIDNKVVNKFGFDNRTLFEEAIWNQSRNLQGEHIYEENFRIQEEGGNPLMATVEGFQAVSESISRIAEPISTRLKQINPKLKNKMRRYEFDLKQRVLQDEKLVKPFLEKYKKLSDKDKADLDLAFKNSDKPRIDEIMSRNNLTNEFESVRVALDALHARARDTGIDIGFIKDYYPRQVKDVKGMLKFFQKQDIWPELAKAIKEKEEKLGRKMNDNEKAELLNTMLRGFKGGKAKPGNLKAREISVVTPHINQFYQDSPQALLNYIYKVNDYVEARRFFGKSVKGSEMSAEALEESIGNFVLDLLQSGDIKGTDAEDVSEILQARFGEKGPGKMTSAIKNISYLETMGSVTSAITQIGDIAFSLYKNGFYKTGKAISKAVFNQSEISKEEIGIEKIAEEFADKSTSAKAVDFVFKWIGLQWMDRLGKETQINAAFDKYSKLAEQEPDSKSKKIVGYRVGDNTGQAGAGTFYSLNPTNINSALPNKSTDVKKQNLEFDNLLEISESELFGYKGNPSEYLANKWLKSNFDVLEEGSLMDKAVAEEAVKRGYDGIKYGNLEIQDLRSLRPVGKKSSEKNSKFKKQMEDIFGDEASQVIADLKAKTPSDNVKFLLFSELADVQPIAMSEMPEQYLKGGNGRILYMLKTYTIKQIDVFRNECFIDMADRKREALGRFIRLASMLILANATADILKDLLLGRPLESDDEDYAWVKLTDNIIRLFGLTKYSLYRFKKDGVSEGVSSIVLPPVFNFVTRGAKDIDKAIKDDGDFEPHQTEIIQSVPMLGKLYYWWFGGGRKKIEDEE